jgi:serine/threonine-protein kinase
MGVVHLAEDQRLGRLVALKLLPARDVADRQSRARFLREARAAAAVQHANIATIYEVGEDGDTVFIAMEYVAGRTLRALLAGGPLELREAVRLALAMAEALAVAHAAAPPTARPA